MKCPHCNAPIEFLDRPTCIYCNKKWNGNEEKEDEKPINSQPRPAFYDHKPERRYSTGSSKHRALIPVHSRRFSEGAKPLPSSQPTVQPSRNLSSQLSNNRLHGTLECCITPFLSPLDYAILRIVAPETKKWVMRQNPNLPPRPASIARALSISPQSILIERNNARVHEFSPAAIDSINKSSMAMSLMFKDLLLANGVPFINYLWRIGYFEGCNFTGVNFSGLDLTGIQVPRINLQYANLKNTNLTNANLKAARLSGACFIGSTLKGADLSNTIIVHTSFRLANLNGVVNMPIRGRENPITKEHSYAEKNESRNSCAACSKPFDFFRRKHHCRNCGQIICYDCWDGLYCNRCLPKRS